jgi:hypothetical protein
VETSVAVEVSAAKAGMNDVAEGLIHFQLHPKDKTGAQLFTGLEKFAHLTTMARTSVPRGTELVPSAHLNVAMTNVQKTLLNPSPLDYTMHEIAKTTHGLAAQQNIAKRKLDAMCNFRGESGIANDPVHRSCPSNIQLRMPRPAPTL